MAAATASLSQWANRNSMLAAHSSNLNMPTVTTHQVQTIGRHLRRKLGPVAPMALWAAVAKRVVERFVGAEWIDRHLSEPPNDFFRAYDAPTMEDNAGARRLIDLADMLLNLQDLPGFKEPLGKLRGDSAEAAFGAFEAAKLLHRSRVRFEFVVPRKRAKGEDYDIEAHPVNGPAVPIEAETKLVGTAPSGETISRTLEHARTQLPRARPGMIVVCVPREWGGDAFLLGPFVQAAEAALRGSSRIAGIIGFTSVFSAAGRSHAKFHAAKEVWSKRPEFAAAPGWKLFSSDVFDGTDRWVRIRILLGDKPNLGITAAEAKKRLGITG